MSIPPYKAEKHELVIFLTNDEVQVLMAVAASMGGSMLPTSARWVFRGTGSSLDAMLAWLDIDGREALVGFDEKNMDKQPTLEAVGECDMQRNGPPFLTDIYKGNAILRMNKFGAGLLYGLSRNISGEPRGARGMFTDKSPCLLGLTKEFLEEHGVSLALFDSQFEGCAHVAWKEGA